MKKLLRTSATKAVTGPNAREVYIDAILSDLSESYMQEATNFVAMRAVPSKSVVMQSGRYGKFNRESYWRSEAQVRQEGTTVPLKTLEISRDLYQCEQYAIGVPITDEARQNAESWLDLVNNGTRGVTEDLQIKREQLFLGTILPAANVPWTNSITLSNGNWDDAASDPIADVLNAKLDVMKKTGFKPNRMIIGIETWTALLTNPDILARVTGGATNMNPADVNMDLVARVFELESVYVAGGVHNKANEGATADFDFINAKGVLVYYAPMMVGLNTVSAVTAFNWSLFEGSGPAGAAIRNYYDQRTMTEFVEGFMAFDYKITGADLGTYHAGPVS